MLQGLRAQIEQGLRQRFGARPRFYYGGSYGKGTMLRSAYDLDIVMYFPSTERASLHELFWAVHLQLGALRYMVHPRTVALRLPYDGRSTLIWFPGGCRTPAIGILRSTRASRRQAPCRPASRFISTPFGSQGSRTWCA